MFKAEQYKSTLNLYVAYTWVSSVFLNPSPSTFIVPKSWPSVRTSFIQKQLNDVLYEVVKTSCLKHVGGQKYQMRRFVVAYIFTIFIQLFVLVTCFIIF